MKKFTSVMAVLLSVLMLIPCFSAYTVTALSTYANAAESAMAAIPGETTESMQRYANQLTEEESARAATKAYSYNGYKTYTLSDATLKCQVPNLTYGSYTGTAMQGMNVGTTYCYMAKRNSDDTYVGIRRYNMNTGASTTMSYYSSTSATSASACNSLGHANSLTVCTYNSVNYMYVATLWDTKAITRLKIDGTKLMLTGYFDLVDAGGTHRNASAIKYVKASGGYFYFLVKRGNSFYTCKISQSANGGSASSPTDVNIYKIFGIDTRNAVFATSNSAAGTINGIQDWTNQSFGYNKSEGVLYVPIWDSVTSSRSIILCYNIGADLATWQETTKNLSNTVFPTKTNFMITDTSVTQFEIEDVGFRTGQDSTGDLKLYFNANVSTLSKEGAYTVNYKSGSGDHTPINEGKAVYTVKYNANGGSGTTGSTKHIRGISMQLNGNSFTRSGYSFAGWYLTRKSDGKWLYFNEAGSANWYTKGSQPEGCTLALYENKRRVSALTSVDGDTVTCYAQWTPNSTGTTTFYVQYDANGGTGTAMADTKIIYGTGANLTANTFSRSGYVFTGWTAHRRNKDQWAYKDTTNIADVWLAPSAATSHFLKTYADRAKLSKTTSVDADIVTLYAAWSRVASPVYPTEMEVGTAFSLGGTLESTTDFYGVIVNVKNAGGTVVASHSTTLFTDSYNLSGANASINLSTLGVGSYTYEVIGQVCDGASPRNVTVLSKTFTVVDPAKIMLTDTAQSTNNYTLDNEYFSGFATGIKGAEFKALFKYAVTVTDINGNAVADTDYIGTGYVISCGTESRIAILTYDINCDADVSTADMVSLKVMIKGSDMPVIAQKAADGDKDGTVSTTDALSMKEILKA